jgi:hypothetical protein
MTMLRHLVILARDNSLLPAPLTIALDRHFSRGDQVEIIEDRRRPPDEPTASQWVTGRERRRASTLADELRARGYAIISRDEDGSGLPPRPFERAPVAPVTRAPVAPLAREAPARTVRNERLHAPRDEPRILRYDRPEDFSADPDDRDEFDRPRRRGGLVAVLVVLVVLGAGLFFFSTQARDRLAGALTPAPPPAETARQAETAQPAEIVRRVETARPPQTATPPGPAPSPGPATEAPERAASVAPDPSPPAPLPAAPSLPTPSPALPSRAIPPSATQEAAPVERAAPAPSASASLPPRREEAPVPERSPDPAPQSVRTQRLPDFPGLPRVEVSRAPSREGTTFTVRLADPRGRPLPDAQVWLRQKSTDGFVRETPLEPVSPAGSYRGAVPVGARRANELTVRIVLGDRRMEMPVAE